MSLLMWECGLKLVKPKGAPTLALSLLMWECGLKLCFTLPSITDMVVTPYVGVWIET